MGKLAGKIALITGGTSGIGLATAQQCVHEGAYVFITGRREPELAAAVKTIGSHVTGVQGDVANLGDLDRLFAQIKREKARLDSVFANAGVATFAPFGEITEEHYDALFTINVKGLLFTVQKALPLIRNGGSVILIGSTSGHMGVPGYSAYSATKAALRSYTRTWTREFNDRGIRFNTLSPGPIDTPMLERQPDKAQFAAAVPLNRLGRPEEIAAAALFLASDDSSFVAGVELSVDGGMAQV